MTALPIKIRSATDDDMGHIYSSWKRSLRPAYKWCDRDIYFTQIQRAITRTLKHSEIIIICNSIDELSGYIYGWIVFDPKRSYVHYMFVKPEFRAKPGVAHHGLGTRLMVEAMKITDRKLVATAWSQDGAALMQARPEVFDGLRLDLFPGRKKS